MRKAIEQIEPEHLDWQEYERAARINIKSLKIQLRTAESMVRDARQMMDKIKPKKEEAETCESTNKAGTDTEKMNSADS